MIIPVADKNGADKFGSDTIGSGERAGGETPAGAKHQWQTHVHAVAAPKCAALPKARRIISWYDSDESPRDALSPRRQDPQGPPGGAASHHGEQHGQLGDLGAAAPGDAAVAAGGEANSCWEYLTDIWKNARGPRSWGERRTINEKIGRYGASRRRCSPQHSARSTRRLVGKKKRDERASLRVKMNYQARHGDYGITGKGKGKGNDKPKVNGKPNVNGKGGGGKGKGGGRGNGFAGGATTTTTMHLDDDDSDISSEDSSFDYKGRQAAEEEEFYEAPHGEIDDVAVCEAVTKLKRDLRGMKLADGTRRHSKKAVEKKILQYEDDLYSGKKTI